ncbi:MAG: double zinc ribbon domain-containing protein [Acidocella sp.]|nr:double zinc ribbon domain-containing protein [Acidocella sp.]
MGIEYLLQMKSFMSGALNLLLPQNCLGCDTPVAAAGQFCVPCFRRAVFVTPPFCACCGLPLPYEAAGAGGMCGACWDHLPAFTQARAALRYDELAKALILPFKYADRTDAARGLAMLMRRAGADLLARADVLVPVPLHKSRLRARRYNQAALLAAQLASLSGRAHRPDALIRTRATVALARLSATERQAALAGAIIARKGVEVSGRNVLLIDDVMTTGSTASSCAAALRLAGAARVDVLTIARVASPDDD